MTEENTPVRTAPEVPQQGVEVSKRIPGTSVAVMIFILLVAFACTGVQVVLDMVEAKNAPEVIKGKDDLGAIDYPVLASLPNGIAAEVNGVEIPESQITAHIMEMRSTLGLEDQEAWDDWMKESLNSTETLRNRLILYYVNNEVVDQLAEELGVQPTAEDYQEVRDELLGDPEQKAKLEEALAAEGLTLDDYEADIVTMTKRRLIGREEAEALVDLPEFDEAVMTVIKERYPEYESVESLDEVDQAIVHEVEEEVIDVNVDRAFSEKAHDFLKESKIYYAKTPSDLPYQSNSDEYFMKEEFKLTLKDALEKSGISVGEGSLFDSLMADEEESGE